VPARVGPAGPLLLLHASVTITSELKLTYRIFIDPEWVFGAA